MAKETSLNLVFRPDANQEFGWFFIKDETEYWDLVETALVRAKTVGEFRTMLPVGEFDSFSSWDKDEGGLIYFDGEKYLFSDQGALSEVPNSHEYSEESIVRVDDPFYPQKVIPRYFDGNYPPFSQALQDEFLPGDFCKEYGVFVGSPAVGAWWEFPADKAEDMKAELESLGFIVLIELEGKWPGLEG